MSQDTGGAWDISPPDGTDLLVAVISCDGKWTLTPP